MLNHIVMFRRKADVPADAVLEAALIARMDALGSQIDEIRGWRLSANELVWPISWGYVLESAAEDEEALNACLFHPLHQALIADLEP
ncbi:MAG: Dabb family protein [Lacisediminimonas sp.]|nr:Dabb family protein [Lacisediminimonas sp.]